MNLQFSFKHMKASDAIRDYAKEKSERLKKYFNGRITVAWNFSVEKQNRVAHVHLVGNNMDYFGESVSEDMHASVDLVIEKIERQIRKHKEIVKDHLHRNGHRVPAA
jgi:putative sigma-54 modulation protein